MSSDTQPDPGIFLTKGGQLSIPSFTLSLDQDGKITGDPITLHLGIDVCPVWLRIAIEHLGQTRSAANKLQEARQHDDAQSIAAALELEYRHGMQAIVASGIALDSYYASIRSFAKISGETVNSWRDNRTSRYKQIAETLRVAFKLDPKTTKLLRKVLKQNLKLRDMAVHPKQGTYPPALHVELNKVVAWHYATFRHHNAKAIVATSIQLVFETARQSERASSSRLSKYCDTLALSKPIIYSSWQAACGTTLESGDD
jgi:hypothetical protein